MNQEDVLAQVNRAESGGGKSGGFEGWRRGSRGFYMVTS